MNRINELINQHCPNGAEFLPLGTLCLIKTGPNVNKKFISANPGEYPVINSGKEPLGFVGEWNTDNDPIGIASRGSVGHITWSEGKYFRGNLNYSCTVRDEKILSARYLFHLLHNMQDEIQLLATHEGIPALNKGNLEQLQIPIPPLEVQQEIVNVLDAFTELEVELEVELEAELEARKKQYKYYRNKLLNFISNYSSKTVRFLPIEKVCANANNKRKPVKSSLRIPGKIPYYGANNIQDYVEGHTHEGNYVLIAEDGSASLDNYSIQYTNGKFWANNHVHVIQAKSEILNNRFLFHYLKNMNFRPFLTGGGRAKLTKSKMIGITIPTPSLEEQGRIVDILDKFDTLVNDISIGLPAEITARRQQYEYYRNQLLTFKELA